MSKSIISYLEELPDERRRAGQRHDKAFILLLVLMATMSGYHGYRAIGDFITRNRGELISQFRPKKGRLPTFYTVRRVLQSLDFGLLSRSFYQWSQQYTDIGENEWLHIDGKAMKGTVSDYSIEKQRFINLVSVYSSRKGLVAANALVDNSKQSEIPVVQQLIASLGLNGATLTLDALHCQKKL